MVSPTVMPAYHDAFSKETDPQLLNLYALPQNMRVAGLLLLSVYWLEVIGYRGRAGGGSKTLTISQIGGAGGEGEFLEEEVVLGSEPGGEPGLGFLQGFLLQLWVGEEEMEEGLEVSLPLGGGKEGEDFVGLGVEEVVEGGFVGSEAVGEGVSHQDVGFPLRGDGYAGFLLGGEPGGEAAEALASVVGLAGAVTDGVGVVGVEFQVPLVELEAEAGEGFGGGEPESLQGGEVVVALEREAVVPEDFEEGPGEVGVPCVGVALVEVAEVLVVVADVVGRCLVGADGGEDVVVEEVAPGVVGAAGEEGVAALLEDAPGGGEQGAGLPVVGSADAVDVLEEEAVEVEEALVEG